MLELNTNSFSTGQIFMTAAVSERIAEDEQFAKFVLMSVRRHLKCDWGELGEEDKALNDAALNPDFPDRLFSAYNHNDDKIWIISEHDRSYTTILFPSEY